MRGLYLKKEERKRTELRCTDQKKKTGGLWETYYRFNNDRDDVGGFRRVFPRNMTGRIVGVTLHSDRKEKKDKTLNKECSAWAGGLASGQNGTAFREG